MTKVEKLRDEILCIIIDCVNGQAHDDAEATSKLDELIAAVKEETLTCKYCGYTFTQLYCDCDAFNDE